MTRRALWLAAACLALASPAIAETRGIAFYAEAALAKERPRYDARIHELYGKIDTLLSAPERSALARLEFDFPSFDPQGGALNFFSGPGTNGPRVTLPMQSLMLVEDICLAYAWLQLNNYNLHTIDQYATMVKYKKPSDFPGGRYPPPLTALGIPANALDNEAVGNLSLRLRNSAWAFILVHELGHVVLGHRGYAGLTMEEARAHETAADRFALDVLLRRAHDIPLGAVLFFQAQVYLLPNPGEYVAHGKTLRDWEKALRETETHPLTTDRLQAIALAIDAAAPQWPRPQERVLLLSIASQLAEAAEIMSDVDMQHCMTVAAERADPQELKPQRPGEAGIRLFLERCVKR